MCVAGAGNIAFDIFGRPANQNTLRLDDSACSNYTQFPARRLMEIENAARPYLNICAAGNRGASDAMGVGRDRAVQNVYGDGYGGNFVRHYDNASNAPWERPMDAIPPYYQQRVQPWTGSMDATGYVYRG